MMTVEEWSIRLAQEVAPDEAELAPMMAQAFIAGGQKRRDLFARSSAVGAFGGADLIGLMPLLYSSLAALGDPLVGTLTSSAVGGFLDCVKTSLTLVELRQKTQALRRPPGMSGARIPEDPPFAPLRGVVESLLRELQRSGLPEDRAELVTFRVLRALLEEPQAAPRFVSIGGGSRRSAGTGGSRTAAVTGGTSSSTRLGARAGAGQPGGPLPPARTRRARCSVAKTGPTSPQPRAVTLADPARSQPCSPPPDAPDKKGLPGGSAVPTR